MSSRDSLPNIQVRVCSVDGFGADFIFLIYIALDLHTTITQA